LNIGGEDARYTSDVMRFIDAFMSVLGLLSVGLFVSSLSSKAKNYN